MTPHNENKGGDGRINNAKAGSKPKDTKPLPGVRIKSCGTCHRVLEVDPPTAPVFSNPSNLEDVVKGKFDNNIITVGNNKPVHILFMHLIADVRCMECNWVSKVEIRL